MKMTAERPQAHQPPLTSAPAYQAPRVNDLGQWQAVTLIYSVPINPGTMFNPGVNPNG
ncbi:hypothetical protein [Deinococcus sp.]|uniref:hypothetical protein n=1 Tax=Deinococcus sp. TaxID=47478 RepID=UPI0025BEDC58|nr:hypothetical protein [Deinococcus sp.]